MGNNTRKFFIWSTNACIERILDCQKIHDYLVHNGWVSVKDLSRADLIVVSTCSLTEEEDKSSEDYIRFCLRRKRKTAEIIIAGCMPVIVPDKFSKLGRFLTVSPTNFDALDKFVKGEYGFNESAEPNIVVVSKFHKLLFKKWLKLTLRMRDWFSGFKSKKGLLPGFLAFLRKHAGTVGSLSSAIDPFLVNSRNDFFYLRISRGCLGECSYCAKRFSTGRLKSRDREAILREFEAGLKKRYEKFYLVSEDCGCYGRDINSSVLDLLEQIFSAGREYRFKLVIPNFNAQWLVKYYEPLERMLVANRDKVLYLQVPVQSGSDRILRLMNRHYNIADVQKCLLRLKKKAPGLPLKTDIIVGFPGENEEDFLRTRKFMEKMEFDFADIFPFQNRQNTPAYDMPGKVPEEIKESRARDLLKIRKYRPGSVVILKKAVELVKDFYV